MAISLINTSHLRLSLPEPLWLEPEYFEQANADSEHLRSEPDRWKAYLNSLSLSAFEAWAKENLPAATIRAIAPQTAATRHFNRHLNIEGFKTCLITTEHVLDETIRFPESIIQQPELAAHLYVVIEVLEEQQEAVIRGFLRYDELIQQLSRVTQPSASQASDQRLLPLSLWDQEINHLLGYVQYSHPSTVQLPEAAVQPAAAATKESIFTRLSQWLDNALTGEWQSINRLINPQASLAWNARQNTLGTKGGKLLNLGMQIDQHPVALIITVVPEEERIGVNVQVLPTGEDLVLPMGLTVTLRSSADVVLQTVTARAQDNYIQLRPFRGNPGIRFVVEVVLNGVTVSEAFEL